MRVVLTLVILGATASLASAQIVGSIQGSGDILADVYRQTNVGGSAIFESPFSAGFVTFANEVLNATSIGAVVTSSGTMNPNLFQTFGVDEGTTSLNSAIYWNFLNAAQTVNGISVPATSVTMESVDQIPTIETKLPRGLYTFHCTATPVGTDSTPGVFQFQTLTQGVWSVRFSLNLSKAEGETINLNFNYDTRVRWMLIRTGSAAAKAAIVAQFVQDQPQA